MLRKHLLDTSRGRIVTLLQHGALTVDDIASKLGLTASGVRAQVTAMERDGVLRTVGQRAGPTRPSRVFGLTPEVDQLLSKAYVPLLTRLVDVFANGLPAHQMDALLRESGKKLAEDLSSKRPAGSLRSRVTTASELLNEKLGAVTHVEENGHYIIRGEGCPLSALTGKHPAACRAVESLVTELVGASVHECCDRAGRPRCCFEISNGPTPKPPARPRLRERRKAR